jgi:hypothetical protein
MKSTIFNGYNKIDDNGFSNTIAFLTGRKDNVHESEIDGYFRKDFIDHYPFLWKNFSEKDYFTGLVEEQDGVFPNF